MEGYERKIVLEGEASTTSSIDDGTTPPHLLFRSAGKKQAAAGVQRFLNFQSKKKGFENLRARTFTLSIGMDAAMLVSRSEKDLGFWIKKENNDLLPRDSVILLVVST